MISWTKQSSLLSAEAKGFSKSSGAEAFSKKSWDDTCKLEVEVGNLDVCSKMLRLHPVSLHVPNADQSMHSLLLQFVLVMTFVEIDV